MPSVAPVDELRAALNPGGVPDFEAIATSGEGVFDTLKAIAKLVLTELKRGGAGGPGE
jgi:mutual gliding-motility protein MglA